jgi:hypothetical protein
MAVSTTHTGWHYDVDNSRLDFYYRGTRVGHINASGLDLAVSGDLGVAAGTLDVQDGGTVTQATNRTTGVTLSTHSGQITGDDASLAAVTIATHTVTNTKVSATDVIVLSKVSGDADTNAWVSAVASGSFNVSVRNNHDSSADTTAFVYNFVVIKGATS